MLKLPSSLRFGTSAGIMVKPSPHLLLVLPSPGVLGPDLPGSATPRPRGRFAPAPEETW